jgi:hypothetical protein
MMQNLTLDSDNFVRFEDSNGTIYALDGFNLDLSSVPWLTDAEVAEIRALVAGLPSERPGMPTILLSQIG